MSPTPSLGGLLEILITGTLFAFTLAVLVWRMGQYFIDNEDPEYPDKPNDIVERCINCGMPVYLGRLVDKHIPDVFYNPDLDAISWRHVVSGNISCSGTESNIASPRIINDPHPQ
jgi:hypothetical protein